MADEQVQAAAPTEPNNNNEEIKTLLDRINALDRKNKELLEEKRKFAGVEKTLATLPDGTDINSLLEFKQKAEQNELEKKGQYTEARTKLEEQFRERLAEKDKSIEVLEAKVRDLEHITPAISSLAEVVHDPTLVLNNFVPKDKIEIKDGVPVVNTDPLDGPLPIGDWVKKNLAAKPYLFTQPRPQGSGAPAGKSGTSDLPIGMKENPFENGGNVTEQMRLYRANPDLYERLRAQAKR